MKPVVAMLPMDDRPVNYDYPTYLARLAGYDLHLPLREWLGNPWRDSQPMRLVDWLDKEADSADVLIIALDTLAYGGLIPSRISREPLDSVLERLTVLRKIKAKRSQLPILASSVILRISRANSSEEEKDYWAKYGSAMFRLSYLEHKIILGEASSHEQKERSKLSNHIPGDVYDDYRAGRQRNHQVNLRMIDWLAEGIFDFLLLPQDDTAEYGWNIAEAHTLQTTLRSKNITDRAITYPGADEIGCLLLASAVCQQAEFKPRVYPRYSSIHSASIVTSYEDRSIHELVKAHLTPMRGTIAASPEQADLVLFLNAPAYAQGEASLQWLIWKGMDTLRADLPASLHAYLAEVETEPTYRITRREMDTPERSPEELVRALLVELKSKHPVALADVAFVNGADLTLGNLLMQHIEATHLVAYGAWNTAGNTLGCVLAHAVLRLLAQRNGIDPDPVRAHYEFLFLRFLDDYYYQARQRSQCMLEDLPAMNLQPSMERLPASKFAAVEKRVRERMKLAGNEVESLFIDAGVVKAVKVENIHLPWQRLFEVGFEVKVT
ncbi:MAG: hypothetical protein A2Z71_00905 [Chloroflexi bacterium RBG_13_50_21]|nr:MAG: hypothetical protein A2Z71_00905 [Chloroflexi bacterium RBG_13_50_21]